MTVLTDSQMKLRETHFINIIEINGQIVDFAFNPDIWASDQLVCREMGYSYSETTELCG